MLFLLLACGNPSTETKDSATTENTTTQSCFSDSIAEPYIVYSTPYDADGNPANTWHFQQGEAKQDFTMGRATSGQIQISTDGSWGVVVQQDGSLGIFRQEEGIITVLESAFVPSTDAQDMYASAVEIDSQQGMLYITDSNWPNNGGGLFRSTIDCQTGSITATEKLFSSKNALASQFVDADSMVYITREIDGVYGQVSMFDRESMEKLGTIDAFGDDEAIFSAVANNGADILVGDNNSFSGIPNRVAHMYWNGRSLEKLHEFTVEDPMGIAIYENTAIISSGFGDSLWKYELDSQTLSEIPITVALPSTVLLQHNTFYIAENTSIVAIRDISTSMSSEKIIELDGLEGIIGAIAVFGEY